MTFNINGYSEKDLKDDYDRGILDGYGMAIADFLTVSDNLVQQIEDPPKLREVAMQVIDKTRDYVNTQLEDCRDMLLIALVEKPKAEPYRKKTAVTTNRDKLNEKLLAMSNLDLAEFILNNPTCRKCPVPKDACGCNYIKDCDALVADWLSQEARG